MKFKIMEMLANDHFVTMDNCRGALNDHSTFIVQNPSVVYAYSIEYVRDRWLFIYCDYDTTQYRDTVYDTIQECEVDNPRSRTQNELKQQFFAIYDCEGMKLYLSNFQKKGALVTFLNQHFDPKVKLRECFLDMNQFAGTIQFMKSIRLVQDQALRKPNGKGVFKRTFGNDLGIDAPAKAVTRISLPHEPLANIQPILQKLRQKKDDQTYDEVVIIGEDAFGAEQKFDYESFIGDINIDVKKDSDNRYIAAEVRDRLIATLGGVENVHDT